MNPAARPATADLRATLLTWGPIVAGLAFLFAPSFINKLLAAVTPEQHLRLAGSFGKI